MNEVSNNKTKPNAKKVSVTKSKLQVKEKTPGQIKAASRYKDDLEYRESCKKRNRTKYQTDKEYQEYTLKNANERYHNDPEYRAATNLRARLRYQRLKEEGSKRKKKPNQ